MSFAGELAFFQNGFGMFSLVASALFMALMRRPASLTRAIVKTLAIVSLALLAQQFNAPWLLVFALACAAFGDFLLAFDGDKAFKIGLAGFMLAQLAYVILFFNMAPRTLDLLWQEPLRLVLMLIVLVHSVRLATQLVKCLPPSMGILIAIYALIITLMGFSSLTFANWVIVTGALLFIISDTFVAYERFLLDTKVNQHPWISPVVWITYYFAQTLIAYGVVSATGV
jgi:uncharacterized membrane protein YhhN